jgi:putative endonuclease
MLQRGGCIYILTNPTHSVLYTGVTSDLVARIWQHRNKVYPNSFTAKYNCINLVYYYMYLHIEEAIAAEKAIKAGSRQSKIDLINQINPKWDDLYDSVLNG